MPQTTVVKVTINSVMRSPAFLQGMADYHAGRDIPVRLPVDSEWDYERGRLFAAATGIKYLRVSRGVVEREQVLQYINLRKEKDIL